MGCKDGDEDEKGKSLPLKAVSFVVWLVKKAVLLFLLLLAVVLVVSLADMLFRYVTNTNRDYNMAQDFIDNYKYYFSLFLGFLKNIFVWVWTFVSKFFKDLRSVKV